MKKVTNLGRNHGGPEEVMNDQEEGKAVKILVRIVELK